MPVHLRRRPQKSTAAKVGERLSGLLPAAGKAARGGATRAGGKGAAGLAALAGAGVLAFRYRDRLQSLIARDDGSEQQAAEPTVTAPDASPPTPAPQEPQAGTEGPIPPGA